MSSPRLTYRTAERKCGAEARTVSKNHTLKREPNKPDPDANISFFRPNDIPPSRHQSGIPPLLRHGHLLRHRADFDVVVRWVQEKFAGKRELFMMGDSAGGVHLSTWLYAPDLAGSVSSVTSEDAAFRIRAVVMLSVPFHFRIARLERVETLQAYYGEDVDAHCPLGSLEALSKKDVKRVSALDVDMLVLNGTLDPEDEILKPKEDFLTSYRRALPTDEAKLLTIEMMEGQYHISPVLSLSTGEDNEEHWGFQIRDWMKSIST